jgi:hypothetical protein
MHDALLLAYILSSLRYILLFNLCDLVVRGYHFSGSVRYARYLRSHASVTRYHVCNTLLILFILKKKQQMFIWLCKL